MPMSTNINEVELGKFLGSIDVIPDAFHAVLETSSPYEIHNSPSGIKILAFNCLSADYTTRFFNGEFKLLSSQDHKVVDFISIDELNSIFFINKVAFELFESLPSDVKALKEELIKCPLVVTGRGLGGYIAILFALWLHQAVDVKESNDVWTLKRPVCITFGCPLVGDEKLQLIISKYPQWESRFLNVVMKDDHFAGFFKSDSVYKPFGTFLFCMESGERTASQDQDLVLAVLDKMGSPSAQNMETQDYRNSISAVRRKALYRGVSESGEFDKQEYFKDLLKRMKEKQEKTIYEPTKKLNDMKIRMVSIEWCMKMMKSSDVGIYDFYKNEFKTREEINIKNKIIDHQRALTTYWEWFVEETKKKPQKKDAKMRKRWLLNGHNYRRMIEPLDIAEYYKNGNQNYIAQRSNHYLKLEELLKIFKGSINPSDHGNNKAPSLTNDSCFWARVEEALILLSDLKKEDSNVMDIEQKLDGFEVYVMGEINEHSVSPDIFLKKSSFMKWWREYKAYKGSSWDSKLTKYMNNECYNLYE